MDTLLENLPAREDSTLDLNEVMRLELERTVNAIMDAQADEMLGEKTGATGTASASLPLPWA